MSMSSGKRISLNWSDLIDKIKFIQSSWFNPADQIDLGHVEQEQIRLMKLDWADEIYFIKMSWSNSIDQIKLIKSSLSIWAD